MVNLMYKRVLSGLREHGYTNEPGFDSSIFNEKKIDSIRALIRQLLKPVVKYPHKGSPDSYALKSLLEQYAKRIDDSVIQGYITNGECIYAMYLEGYRIRRGDDGKNAYISVSKRKYDALQNIIHPLYY